MNTKDPDSVGHNTVAPPEEARSGSLDTKFADLLAAYDDLLAAGESHIFPEPPDTGLAYELHEAKACLQVLEHVFPRSSELGGGVGSREVAAEQNESDSGNDHPLRTLGQFQILRELGRGGGGIVFLAIDTELGRKVALKVPYPEVLLRRDLRRRFVQETQTAAKLEHPNIIPVYGAGEIGPVCYIASAYCTGPTLAAWLQAREEPVPFRVAAELVAALADAVEHAHSHSILHRDIKPSNVLLELRAQCEERRAESGETADSTLGSLPSAPCPVPKLTDFGLAKLMERERDATRTGAVLGTPTYMAPEQAEGRLADIGIATDVYGLGVVLYELIAGRPPFQGETDLDTLQQIARDDPPPPRLFRKRAPSGSWIRQNSGTLLKFGNFSYDSHTVPRDLEAICLKCLEKTPARRYHRAADLAFDLRRYLDGQPTIARPLGWPTRAMKWTRRRPAVAGI